LTALGPDVLLDTFVVFCRIGACLLLMPGFSSPRVPRTVRLFLAVALTFALVPLLSVEIGAAVSDTTPTTMLLLVFSELSIGAMIGVLGRLYFGALETLTNAIALAIGLSSPLGGPVDDTEPLPPIASLLMLAATVLFFVADLHWEVLRGLVGSYLALPVGGMFDAWFGLAQVTDCLAKSFTLALRISSPFIVYALTVNLAVGLAAKLTSQIPVYFITAPAVVLGGLVLLYATCKPFLEMFTAAMASWLVTG